MVVEAVLGLLDQPRAVGGLGNLSFAALSFCIISGISFISSGMLANSERIVSGSTHSCMYCPANASPVGVAKKRPMSLSCCASKRRAIAPARPSRIRGSMIAEIFPISSFNASRIAAMRWSK